MIARVSTAARDTETWGCAVLHFADGTRGTAYGSDLALGGMSSQLELRASDARLLCRLSPHDQLSAYAPRDGVFGDAYVMEKIDGQAGWTTPLPDEDESTLMIYPITDIGRTLYEASDDFHFASAVASFSESTWSTSIASTVAFLLSFFGCGNRLLRSAWYRVAITLRSSRVLPFSFCTSSLRR